MHAPLPHRTWKKRWTIPLWSVQLPLLAISIVILCMLTGIEKNSPKENTGDSSSAQAWTVANLVLAIVVFTVGCVEVSIYIHGDLSPELYFGLNAFKLLIWIVPLAWNISATGSSWKDRDWNYIYLYVAIGLASFVFVTLIASLANALSVFRTYRGRAKALYEKYSASELGSSNADEPGR